MNKEDAGYKYAGVVKEFDEMGQELKPVHEVEVIDISSEEDFELLMDYVKRLKDDEDVEDLFGKNIPRPNKGDLKKHAKKNMGDMYVKKDGKKISLAKYLTNKKAKNTVNNHNFQPRKEDETSNKNPADIQSMLNNTKKVGEY
jgi:hypothetical protein